MIKVYDSATIRFVQGTAIFSDTSILIESPPPVDLDDEVISDEGMNSAADLSNHEIVQLSLEQQDEAELLPEDGLLDLFDVDTAAAEQHHMSTPPTHTVVREAFCTHMKSLR